MSTNPNQQQRMLQVLNREGCMITTHFSFWKGRVRLEPADLSLNKVDIDRHLISLGHKKIMGRNANRIDQFKALGNRFSEVVLRNSFQFLDKLRYVPNNKLEEVRQQLDSIREEAQALVLQFMADFAQLREQAEQEWLTFAQTATDAQGNLLFTEAEVPLFMAKIRNAFPTVQQLQQKFKFSYNVVSINLPEGQVQMQVSSIREEQQIADARSAIIQEEAQKLATESEEFLRNCLVEMRTGLVQCVEQCSRTMADGKSKINQKTLNKLRNYFEQVRSMNFANDRQLTGIIDNFEQQFLGTTAGEYRDNDSALQALRNGVSNLATQARELANEEVNSVIDNFGQVSRRRIQMDAEPEPEAAVV